MPIFRRRHKNDPPPRRLVRSGETYTDDELEAGDVELETVPAAPEPPEDEQAEPWAWGGKDMPGRTREALAAYRALFPDGGGA